MSIAVKPRLSWRSGKSCRSRGGFEKQRLFVKMVPISSEWVDLSKSVLSDYLGFLSPLVVDSRIQFIPCILSEGFFVMSDDLG
jgi:hypothetical protein